MKFCEHDIVPSGVTREGVLTTLMITSFLRDSVNSPLVTQCNVTRFAVRCPSHPQTFREQADVCTGFTAQQHAVCDRLTRHFKKKRELSQTAAPGSNCVA